MCHILKSIPDNASNYSQKTRPEYRPNTRRQSTTLLLIPEHMTSKPTGGSTTESTYSMDFLGSVAHLLCHRWRSSTIIVTVPTPPFPVTEAPGLHLRISTFLTGILLIPWVVLVHHCHFIPRASSPRSRLAVFMDFILGAVDLDLVFAGVAPMFNHLHSAHCV